MTGFTLDRSEFLVLMDAVEADAVVGIDPARLIPQDEGQLRSLMEAGFERLKERGALRVVDDVNIMDIDLLSMALLVANPEIAVITTRDNPGLGQQLFLHYAAGDVIVEQTLPDQTHHRWALVAGQTGLVERVLGILPVQGGATAFSARIKQADFLEAKSLIEAGQADQGRARFRQAGLSGPGVEGLIDAIARPKFGGMVAALQCRHGEATDARNLALVQGAQAAFLLLQSPADPETLEITTTDEPKTRSLLINWLAELSARQN